ncbi:uncharacterized protein LOC110984639, partial [Acanthaster planci]|uniref:Uncharacterized protein LOC110984639 n=1 Tax=Acanthaster planci TaxID=133434 RepID=A0A8B7Z4Y4_ACAPL
FLVGSLCHHLGRCTNNLQPVTHLNFRGAGFGFDCFRCLHLTRSSLWISQPSRQAVDSLLAILGLAEMIISIVTASMSCYGVCVCCNSYTPVTVQCVPQPANALFVPMTTMQQQQQADMNVQKQLQQQPVRMPAAAKGTSAGPQCASATNYNVAPTQQVANFPQGNACAPQPVGGPAIQAPQPVNVAPQPAGVAPQQLVVTVPGQDPPKRPAGAGMQTAEGPQAFVNQAGVAETGGSEHFHHDDKKGLLETS